jgi:hypothetical protein
VPGLIGSVEVVHRRAKWTGRGMKTLTEGKYIQLIHIDISTIALYVCS